MSAANLANKRLGLFLLDNPFHLLGVDIRQSAARIVEAATDPLLRAAPSEIERARLTLTNPRSRVVAEIGWLPGISPGRAKQVIETLNGVGDLETLQAGLPPAARANVLLSAMQADPEPSVDLGVAKIRRALSALSAIDADELMRQINEDRAVAEFPLVRSPDVVVEALGGQRDLHLKILVRYLDRLPTENLIEVLTQLVQESTQGGSTSPDEVLDGLVSAYEVEAQTFLVPEAATIRELMDAIVVNGDKGSDHVAPAMERLIGLLIAWDQVAQPLQLIRRADGDGHALSRNLASHIRNASVDLANKHQLFDEAAALTSVLSRFFTDVSDLRDVFEKDAVDLQDIREDRVRREQAEADEAYSAKIGLGQTLLSINTKELVWGGRRYPVPTINRVRWGGTSHSTNGIPTGTTYIIAFGSGALESEVSTRSKEVFLAFTSRLWRICGVPILLQMLEQLRAGQTIRIGAIRFSDDRVALLKSKFLAKAEVREFKWSDVHIWSADGDFYVAAKADKGFQAKASYQKDANAHVLSNLIGAAFDRGMVQLSRLLD